METSPAGTEGATSARREQVGKVLVPEQFGAVVGQEGIDGASFDLGRYKAQLTIRDSIGAERRPSAHVLCLCAEPRPRRTSPVLEERLLSLVGETEVSSGDTCRVDKYAEGRPAASIVNIAAIVVIEESVEAS